MRTIKTSDFSRNQITTIPPAIARMTGLTKLALWNNAIARLPAEMGHLSALNDMDLSGYRCLFLVVVAQQQQHPAHYLRVALRRQSDRISAQSTHAQRFTHTLSLTLSICPSLSLFLSLPPVHLVLTPPSAAGTIGVIQFLHDNRSPDLTTVAIDKQYPNDEWTVGTVGTVVISMQDKIGPCHCAAFPPLFYVLLA